ncbi:MAG TPA: efflux RND transporter periplasmic adaptor subunit [Polyangiales bacterium]|nr:efflux RND transporter periplasmic adaptor subunit [Polyangiales bacterium]
MAEAVEPAERFSEPMQGRVVVDERRVVRVGSPLAGRVEQVHVELGQRVKRGAPLITITSLQLPALRDALAQADNALTLARADDARVQSMVNERLMPAKEAISSAARLRQAQLAQHEAAARLRALRLDTSQSHRFVLRAEIAGTIVEKHVVGSQAVTPSDSLLQIADLDAGLFVIADVFESDLGTIKEGAPARIKTRNPPFQTLDSRVDMVAHVVDPVRRTVQVRMRVTAAPLRINQRVEATILRSAPAGAAEIASAAVLSDGDRHGVFVLDDGGKIQRRAVLPGWENAGRVVILAGLNIGERVVEQGAHLLESRRPELF